MDIPEEVKTAYLSDTQQRIYLFESSAASVVTCYRDPKVFYLYAREHLRNLHKSFDELGNRVTGLQGNPTARKLIAV